MGSARHAGHELHNLSDHATSIRPLLAALLLGIADVFGKYYAPKLGAFLVHTLMTLILLCRPQGLFARRGARQMSAVRGALAAQSRWRWWEFAALAALALSWFVLPGHALLANEIAILALFALSLNRILGYAGIVSLGHAAFFAVGAYAAAPFQRAVVLDRRSVAHMARSSRAVARPANPGTAAVRRPPMDGRPTQPSGP